MKFDFYRNVNNFDVLVETLEDIVEFGKMDDLYILTDSDRNQFIRNFNNYSGIDVWYDEDEYPNPEPSNPEDSAESGQDKPSNVIKFPDPQDFIKDNLYNRYLANIQGYNG